MTYDDIASFFSVYADLRLGSLGVSRYRSLGWGKTYAVYDFDLLIAASGCFMAGVGDARYSVPEGCFFLFRPDQTVTVTHAGVHCDVLYVHFIFQRDDINTLFDLFSPLTGRLPADGARHAAALGACLNDQGQLLDAQRYAARGYTLLLTDALLRMECGALTPQSPRLSACRTFLHENRDRLALFEAVRYLDQNLAHLVTASELSRALGMDDRKLSRLMRTYNGCSTAAFILDHRMWHAKRMLDAGLRVQEVALRLGYSDPFAFSRAFSALYGVPPSRLDPVP